MFEPGNVQVKNSPSSDDISINDTVGAWLSDLDLSQTQPKTDGSNLSKYNQHEDIESANTNIDSAKDDYSEANPSKFQEATDPWLAAYHELIPKTEGYQWLLSRLKQELLMAPAKPSFMDTINNLITQSLQSSPQIGHHTSTTIYDAEFEVDWDIMAFLEQQQYSTALHEAIERVITVTGSYQDSYVTTCGQYIDQTWPSSGRITMQLVKVMVGSKIKYQTTSKSTSQRLIIDNDIF